MSQDVYVVELQAWEPVSGSVVTLRYATAGFTTLATDTPPNTFIDGRLLQPALMQRDIFSSGTTAGRSRSSYGDLVLLNGDGALDGLLTYGFDGRSITIRRGPVGAAYPAGFVITAGDITAIEPEADQDQIVIKIRDRQFELQNPLQPNKYAGSNVLPAGLEGVATDLLGKPKPRCFGQVFNVPAVCVNTARLIYQVNDGPVNALTAVYDRGIRLAGGQWPAAPTSLGAAFDNVRCVAFGAGLYVAVGEDVGNFSRISTSPDGVTWTARSSGTTEYASGTWNDVIWVPSRGLFVTVGFAAGGGKVSTSPDGITWTAQTSFSTFPQSIAYSDKLGLFIGVATAGTIATSPDATTWTARTSGTAQNLNRVIWANGLLVVMGQTSTVLTSPDGITWTSRTNSFGVNIRGIAYGAGLYVGVGDSGALVTSIDGVTWAATRLTGVGGTLWNVRYGDIEGIFWATGAAGVLLNSPDGINWTARASGFGASAIFDACLGGSGWLIVGENGNYALNSMATYADAFSLQDDSQAPAPGEVKAYLAGGYFRLGSPPDGLITADVLEGASGDRSAARIIVRLLADPLGEIVLPVSRDDLDALQTAAPGDLGFWTADEVLLADVVDALAGSPGAWWGLDRLGIVRVQQFTAPTGSPVIAFTAADLKEPLRRVPLNDADAGLPSWLTVLAYAHNYSVQTTDLAAGVTDDRRNFVAASDRTVSGEDDSVTLAHPLAVQTLEPTLFANQADAQAEATRRQALRGVRRDRFQTVVPLSSETEVLDLGQVITQAHPRYGLSGAPSFRILGATPDVKARSLTLQIWK